MKLNFKRIIHDQYFLRQPSSRIVEFVTRCIANGFETILLVGYNTLFLSTLPQTFCFFSKLSVDCRQPVSSLLVDLLADSLQTVSFRNYSPQLPKDYKNKHGVDRGIILLAQCLCYLCHFSSKMTQFISVSPISRVKLNTLTICLGHCLKQLCHSLHILKSLPYILQVRHLKLSSPSLIILVPL